MNIKRVLVLTMGMSLLFAGIAFGQMQDPEAEEGMPEGEEGMPGMQQAPDVDVDDDELERFAEALVDVQMIQQDAQVDVQEAVEESGIEMQRFQEIHQGQMAPDAQGEVDASDEEQSAYDDAISNIEEIETAAAEEMEEAVADHDFETDRFNTLAQAIPQDPELSQELNEIAQEIMQERGVNQGGGNNGGGGS